MRLNFFGQMSDRRPVLHIDLQATHSRMRSGDLVDEHLTASSDDNPVAELVKSLSEPPADAARAAGYENGVASQMHGLMLLLLGDRNACSAEHGGLERVLAPLAEARWR